MTILRLYFEFGVPVLEGWIYDAFGNPYWVFGLEDLTGWGVRRFMYGNGF